MVDDRWQRLVADGGGRRRTHKTQAEQNSALIPTLLKFKQGNEKDIFDALMNWGNDEVVVDHCNWFGIECSDGRVNNSFYGNVIEGIAQLNELEVLDLGDNNFNGSLPTDPGNNISLTIL
ncbi:Protein MALE DISCOVERER 2, partial [Mucuna pruriens]